MDDDTPDPVDRLQRLAGALIDDPAVARTPLADLEHRARRRSGQRRASVAAAVVLVLLVVGGLVARAGTPDASVETQTPPTTELPPRLQGDLVIYLNPNASPGEIQAIRDALVADPSVHRILFQSQEDTYQDFRCLFADSPEMVDNVTSDILPPNFRLYLDGDQAAIDRLTSGYAEQHPGVRDIIPVPKSSADQVPAVLVLPTGTSLSASDAPGSSADPEHLDCPQIGEWLK